MSAKISIIIPFYNVEKYFAKCLDSVLNQTHQNLEIILTDDGSTDKSSQIAKSYAKKDSRIKIIHQKNQGQSAARNAGLRAATGDFISFIDSDDEIKPDFIKNLLSAYDDSVAISVCGI
ncbi:glycosyltransferase family 2 protein, partial [Candidatus Saccharibacteria bacterium]|nr:glycosyltransferase family 2 protein [Candidatus Saccharibacteria bacterium]